VIASRIIAGRQTRRVSHAGPQAPRYARPDACARGSQRARAVAGCGLWTAWKTKANVVTQNQIGRVHLISEPRQRDPSEVSWVKNIYVANQGIGGKPDERAKVAEALGFRTMFACVSSDGVWKMLSSAHHLCRSLAGSWLWPFSAKAVELFVRVLEYHVPKLARSDLTGDAAKEAPVIRVIGI
jgi:hypothetical protein